MQAGQNTEVKSVLLLPQLAVGGIGRIVSAAF
ncbi:MAG: hypothetical protein H6Q31_1326 [Bacteroidetes bacterium]|jgi:hypothetical protein|nr:hypothetical protein [Bacteroidota bacterium]